MVHLWMNFLICQQILYWQTCGQNWQKMVIFIHFQNWTGIFWILTTIFCQFCPHVCQYRIRWQIKKSIHTCRKWSKKYITEYLCRYTCMLQDCIPNNVNVEQLIKIINSIILVIRLRLNRSMFLRFIAFCFSSKAEG